MKINDIISYSSIFGNKIRKRYIAKIVNIQDDRIIIQILIGSTGFCNNDGEIPIKYFKNAKIKILNSQESFLYKLWS